MAGARRCSSVFAFRPSNGGLFRGIYSSGCARKKKGNTFRQAFLDGAFTVPGDGCIDYVPFLKVLKEKNYGGWLVVEAEQDPAKANPFE